ncbi:MAG: 4Fe-4S dicluster domain-containing protein [Gammaproteobacteria bacterium]
MSDAASEVPRYLARADFDALVAALATRGYRVIGPRIADGAVVYDELDSGDELPLGWGDEQEGGHYRLRRRNDAALFGYNLGPMSWKRFLHPPRVKLLEATRTAQGALHFTTPDRAVPRQAFLGVRACELAAIAVQDRVLTAGLHVDPYYASRRASLFLVAVNCGQAAATCFCAAMDTGPRAQAGFDVALTEVIDAGAHGFLVESGSPAGAALLAELPTRAARDAEIAAGAAAVAGAARAQHRTLQTAGIRDALYDNLEHPRWDDVAARCLTCANCTMVCPTCFCTTVEDTTDLRGDHAERWRRWDSCFTLDFTHLHGGPARSSAKSRYRQWLTHKLAGWHDQFGESGCVGCGRCITWCPVGIDITAEVRALRATAGDPAGGD